MRKIITLCCNHAKYYTFITNSNYAVVTRHHNDYAVIAFTKR